MDPPNRPLHMREQLKQIYRARLPNIGWCDDNARRKQQVEAAYSQVRGDWEAEASSYQSVVTAALEASTTDNEHQTIDMTLPNDRSFWSSAAHPSQVGHEALLYELQGPASRVVSIKLAPYRALYQDGYPVYPPTRLQVWVGNPYNLQPASPWHDVQASDALQTFALWPHAPLGRYLQVRMYGVLQKQREDMQFYVAIRHVDATGAALATPELLALQPLLRSNTLQLAAPTPSIPATCSDTLQAAADFGLGPEAALLGSPAAGAFEHCASPAAVQRWRQQQKLVARPGTLRQAAAQQSAGPAAAIDHQQQQQQQGQQQGSAVQRVTAGIRSILGRRAAAVEDPAQAGPSKRPQQQQQQPAPPAPPLPSQQHWQQQWQGPPLWLSDEAAVLSDQWQGQQQQQQAAVGAADSVQHSSRQQTAAASGTYMSPSDDSADDSSSVSSDGQKLGPAAAGVQEEAEAAEGMAGAAGLQAVAQQEGLGPASATADLDGAAWEAAHMLHQQIAESLQRVPPWQQEQVLAELLADEPGGGRASRGDYRQHLAHLQDHLQQQQQQQSDETTPLMAPPTATPVVALLHSSRGRAADSSSSGWGYVPSLQEDQEECGCVVKARAVLDQQVSVASWFEADEVTEALAGVDEAEQRSRQRYAAAYHAAAAAAAVTAGGGAEGGRSSSSSVCGLLPQQAGSSSGGPAAAPTAPLMLQASHLFSWHVHTPEAAGGSSTVSTAAGQWLQPAGCFCEGVEADMWVC